MLAHGFVERATKDVDLFTDRDADEAVGIIAALRTAVVEAGLRVEPAPRPPHENRFIAVDPATGASVQVEVFPDGGRLHDPVQLAVGPVLHPEDLAADKTLAMWGRGEPRDYVDVVALLQRYDRAALFGFAQQKDRGLTEDTFIVSLRMVRRFGDEEWADAGIDPARGAATRATILDWADRLDP